MKHFHVLNIVLSVAAYAMAILFAREWSDTWGLAQWTVLAIALPLLSLSTLTSWRLVTRP